MTDCRTQLTFDFHPRKAVVADFDGGLISSDAGLLPIRQLDARLGWSAAVADVLDDSRQAGKVEHVLPAVLRQRPMKCRFEGDPNPSPVESMPLAPIRRSLQPPPPIECTEILLVTLLHE